MSNNNEDPWFSITRRSMEASSSHNGWGSSVKADDSSDDNVFASQEDWSKESSHKLGSVEHPIPLDQREQDVLQHAQRKKSNNNRNIELPAVVQNMSVEETTTMSKKEKHGRKGILRFFGVSK